jgi:S1-C subfamily serine protease
MFVTKLKFAMALALTVTLVGVVTSVIAGGSPGAKDHDAQSYALAKISNADEPKTKDKDKDEEKPQGFLGIRFDPDQGDGPPIILDVIEDSPAAKAGLKEKDVIVKVGDKEAKDVPGTVEIVRALKPGQKVTVKVKREGKEMDIKVTVGTRPAEDGAEQVSLFVDRPSIEELMACWEDS